MNMRNKYIVSAECAIKYQDKYLIIKRPSHKNAGGYFSFPGGGCELSDGENGADVLVQTATREVLEEIGVALNNTLFYVCSNLFYDDINNSNVIHAVFYCKLDEALEELNVCSEEVPEYYWLTASEIISNDATPDWIRKYIKIIEEKFIND